MSWGRIDDQLHKNPKFAFVSLAAIGLWTLCLSYANDKLTDGFIDTETARQFGGEDAEKLIEELCRVAPRQKKSLWHPAPDGYQIHDYLEYSPSRDEVIASRTAVSETKSRAGRAGGLRSGEARRSRMKQNEADPSTAKHNEPPVPVPVPVPLPIDITKPSVCISPAASYAHTGAKPLPKTAAAGEYSRTDQSYNGELMTADWNPTPKSLEWAASKHGRVDAEIETEKFRRHYLAATGKRAASRDWSAVWEGWIIRAAKEYNDTPAVPGIILPPRAAPSVNGRHSAYITPAEAQANIDRGLEILQRKAMTGEY